MLTRLLSPDFWGALLDQVWLWHAAGVLLGWLVFPVVFSLMRPLSDRGYAVSRIFGAFLLTFFNWLICQGIRPFSAGSLGYSLIVLAILSLVQVARVGPNIVDFARRRWKWIVTTECLALFLFLALVNIRSYAADINYNPGYHGAEKLANMMLLSSLWRADTFPAEDSWLAADNDAKPEDPKSNINYYYGGHLQWATLARLTGRRPEIAFNLALATLFSWIGMGAFGLALNLTGRLRMGVIAALFVVFAGNLEPLDQIGKSLWPLYKENKALEENYMKEHPDAAPYPVARFSLLDNFRLWNASRVILRAGSVTGDDLTVNEFPYFSFILGDLHAHSSALPLTLLLLHVLLALYLRKDESARTWFGCAQCYPHSLLTLSLLVGGLYWFNSWEVVPLAIWLAALLFLDSYDWKLAPWSTVFGNGWFYVLMFGLGIFLLLGPFSWNFQSPLTGSVDFQTQTALIGSLLTERPIHWDDLFGAARDFVGLFVRIRPWALSSRLYELFLFWGLIWTPLVCLMAVEVARRLRRMKSRQFAGLILCFSLFAGSVLAMKFGGLALPVCLGLAIAAGLLAWREDRGANERFAARLAFGGFCIALTAETIFINDSMGGNLARYNTVFKLYYPAWTMMAIAAVTLFWHTDQRLAAGGRRFVLFAWRGTGAAILALGAVYPGMATYARTDGLFTLESDPARDFHVQREDTGLRQRTLDGLAYLNAPERSPSDLAAIRWLNAKQNISGRPHILEAAGGAYNETGRVAAYTGLPTIMGWQNHELQWRGWQHWAYMQSREKDVAEIYNTTNLTAAVELMLRYNIRYVFVGRRERELYDPAGLAKFGLIAGEAFRSGDTVVYTVADFNAVPAIGVSNGNGGGEARR